MILGDRYIGDSLKVSDRVHPSTGHGLVLEGQLTDGVDGGTQHAGNTSYGRLDRREAEELRELLDEWLR